MENQTGPVGHIFPRTLLQLLEGLRHTDTGEAIYTHMKLFIEQSEANQLELQQAYVDLINTMLTALVAQLPRGSALHTQLQLIAMHLTPPLSKAELLTLRNCLALYQDQLAGQALDLAPLHDAIKTIETGLSNTQASPARSSQQPINNDAQTITTSDETTRTHDRLANSANTERTPQKLERRRVERRRFHRNIHTELSVDAAYRRHLNEKKESLQKLQSTLAHQVTDTIRQHEEFGILLKVELEAMRNTQRLQELEILRNTLITQVGKLQNTHQSLTHRLVETQKYLQLMEADSRQLNDELTRVHLLSLTDELTELPNRRAFMRRLEDEVGRVQRYGSPLPVVVIDIDNFKHINDNHGHSIGDTVLTTYAKHVLSVFRHHDLVARYGGEEFAVVLPNTDQEGAIRAVAKVQRRAAECTYVINGETRPLPTFSAGIALHQEGESPTDVIKRADQALYEAKRLGKNRIELAGSADPDELTSEPARK